MIGLNYVGKTTILRKLMKRDHNITVPTTGFNISTMKYKNFTFTIWDVGGQNSTRSSWAHHYQRKDAIIFVIDAHDRDRINDNRFELHKLLNEDQLKDSVMLLLANKQDLPKAMKVDELTDKLRLKKLRNHNWNI